LGQGDSAASAFARVGQAYPEYRGEAWLARARLAQAGGDIHGALKHYDIALEHAQQAEVGAAARLGAASCLERLGALDEALVMLDAPALPLKVREVRADGLRRRSEASVP
jgi:tetratricopeptide (TPR) repeat protein